MLIRERTQIMVGWSLQRQQHGEQPYLDGSRTSRYAWSNWTTRWRG